MSTAQIQVLNGSGHLTLEWNPDDEAETERMRAEVQHLAAAGYSFFLTETEPADAVAAGRGKLLVRRLEDPVSELSKPVFIETRDDAEPSTRRGRGRPRAEQPDREAVAVRQQRGG